MAINPAIALGVQAAPPLDMLGAYGKAMSIKNLVDGARLQQLQSESLGQKMQFDRQDQVFDLAKEKIGLMQQGASGLMGLSPEQQAAQYPIFRREVMQLTGDTNIPEQFDPNYINRLAMSGMDPKASYDAAQALAQRAELARIQEEALGRTKQPALTGAVTDTVTEGGDAALRGQQVNVADYSGHINDPSYHWRIADLVNRNPMLAGTKMGAESIDTALKLREDRRKAEAQDWTGFSEVTGADGKTYLRRGPDLVLGGNPLNVGQKATEGFRYVDGKLAPIPEYWDQRRQVAEAGATNVRVGVDAYEKKLSQLDAESVADARKGAEQSAGAASDARAIAEILKGQNSGKWTEMQAALGQWLPGSQYAGVTSIVSLAEGIRGRAAPAMRVPGSGATSDFESKLLLGIFPQLIQNDEGRELAARVLERVAERQAIAADIKDEMVRGGTYSVREFNKRIKAEFGDNLLTPEEKATVQRIKKGEKPKMGSQENPYKIRGDDGFDSIPVGSFFIGPDGVPRQKQADTRPKR